MSMQNAFKSPYSACFWESKAEYCICWTFFFLNHWQAASVEKETKSVFYIVGYLPILLTDQWLNVNLVSSQCNVGSLCPANVHVHITCCFINESSILTPTTLHWEVIILHPYYWRIQFGSSVLNGFINVPDCNLLAAIEMKNYFAELFKFYY